MVLKDKCFPILFLYILESTLCSFENFIIYVLYIFFLCLILAYIHIQHVYHGSSCFPIKNCAYGYRKYAGKCHVFHDFTGLTAPLSYAYRMIFGWCSSNAPLGFKESPSHSQWISFRVT